MSKVIVITGSTKGIGLGLADSFLKAGCRVVISGRTPNALENARSDLALRYGEAAVASALCDVTNLDELQTLWQAAVTQFGRVDIWVNNAGSAHPQKNIWELDEKIIQTSINTNLIGLLNGCRIAIRGMQEQGGGQIYNVEGFGSNGRIRKGMGVYGATKAAVAFVNKTLAAELEGTPVQIASIQPGMVITDMVLDQFKENPADLEKFKPILNIIASRVDEVAPVLVQKILANNKHGAHIRYQSPANLMLRFITAPFSKKDLFKTPLDG